MIWSIVVQIVDQSCRHPNILALFFEMLLLCWNRDVVFLKLFYVLLLLRSWLCACKWLVVIVFWQFTFFVFFVIIFVEIVFGFAFGWSWIVL